MHASACVAALASTPAHPFYAAPAPRTQVYDTSSSQTEIFDITARPIIDAVMDGYNGAAVRLIA